MTEAQFPWLHALGWTLLVGGGSLWLLTLAATPQPHLRRKLLVTFIALTVLGVLCLGIYFLANPGFVPVDQVLG